MKPAQKAVLEKRAGWDVGRDPRQVSRDELIAAGHKPMSPLKALRARCIDCCAAQPGEVRLCTAVACPSWPFRMGSNPWRKEASDAQREQGRLLARKTAAGYPEAFSAKEEIAKPEAPATSLPEPPLRPDANRENGSEADTRVVESVR